MGIGKEGGKVTKSLEGRRSLPITNEKLLNMARLITDRQKMATVFSADKIDWVLLEEEWFIWLKEELFGEILSNTEGK